MVINVHGAVNGQGGGLNDNDEIWRPVRFHTPDESFNEDERRVDEVLRTFRSLLNKLSPVNFCKILDKFKSLILNNPAIVDQATALLIDKAITEPLFSKWYVEMLCSLSDVLPIDETEESVPYRIRMLFVKKLVLVFEDLRSSEQNIQNREEIDACTDVIKKTELEEQFNESTYKFQRKFIGICRVIAESFNLGILPLSSLTQCIEILLLSYGETSLKCLYELLTNVEKCLKFHLNETEINEYFDSIKKILERTELSTKSRFLFMNLLEFKANLWISKKVLKNLQLLENFLNALSALYAEDDDSVSSVYPESEFSIDTKEALYINKILNKFTQYPRNLANVINSFNELAVPEKTRLVRIFITCVIKGDIYSEECGKLFAVLLQTESMVISDIILGIKFVIYGYCNNLIFADKQIWMRLKEIFQPLFADELFLLSDLEFDTDIKKAKKIVIQKEKKTKKNVKIETKKSTLSWRRGIPIEKKLKQIKYVESKSECISNKQNEANIKENGEES